MEKGNSAAAPDAAAAPVDAAAAGPSAPTRADDNFDDPTRAAAYASVVDYYRQQGFHVVHDAWNPQTGDLVLAVAKDHTVEDSANAVGGYPIGTQVLLCDIQAHRGAGPATAPTIPSEYTQEWMRQLAGGWVDPVASANWPVSFTAASVAVGPEGTAPDVNVRHFRSGLASPFQVG